MPDQLHESFPALPSTPARARAALTAYLGEHGLDELVEPATLVVSELVTNAVLHAGTPVTVRAHLTDRVLHLDVDDGSGARPQVREPTAEGGRGLHIVAAVAAAWGVTPAPGDPNRKTVWCELRPPDPQRR